MGLGGERLEVSLLVWIAALHLPAVLVMTRLMLVKQTL
jgi:hypothetical protein